ncbi:MAG: Zn-dependent hydrolase [Gammaproteobacteria bacterium]|nr:Zn-dependent hydrolase [Gammaproteobacteria bacterium]
MPRINAERLLQDLHQLRTFGACGNGVVRPSLSEIDMASRRWLCERFEAAGLTTVVDGVGNVIGQSANPGPALVVGSHSDTQPTGGWLDGALGVIYGLEVARALAEDERTRHLAVDVASWIDEEGTFLGCLGSRAWCGVLDSQSVAESRNAAGQSLQDALVEAGLSGRAHARLDPHRQFAYLEAHIEQGPYLEADDKRIGVVTGIVGIRGYEVRFDGQQNHAGTTPMALRRDAGMALIEFGHAINQAFRQLAGERTVWTIGRADFEPGAPSIIPGRARMMLQMRDADDALLDAMEASAAQIASQMSAAGPVSIDFARSREPVRPTIMDEALQAHLRNAAEQHASGRWVSMPSAAGHDPMVISHHIPCAMLFIPSIDGISHDFAEDSRADDIVLGCQVLTDAAASILTARQQDG